MSVFYVIVSLLVLLPDLYIRLVCLRGVVLGWWALLFWAPLAFFVVLLVTYFAGNRQSGQSAQIVTGNKFRRKDSFTIQVDHRNDQSHAKRQSQKEQLFR